MQQFKNIHELLAAANLTVGQVMQALDLGSFVNKSNPKYTVVSFKNKEGKRQFLNRDIISKDDGTKAYAWKDGDLMREKQPQQAPAQIQVAA